MARLWQCDSVNQPGLRGNMLDEMVRVAARSVEQGKRRLPSEDEEQDEDVADASGGDELKLNLRKRLRSGEEGYPAWSESRRCHAQGCTKFFRSGSRFCILHGGDTGIKSGEEGYPAWTASKRCQALGCTKFYRSGSRFCVLHGGGKRCTAQGCPKSAQGRTPFCSRHGGGNRCQAEGCRKGARGRSSYCIAHAEEAAQCEVKRCCLFEGCGNLVRGRAGAAAYCIPHQTVASRRFNGLASPCGSNSHDSSSRGSLCNSGVVSDVNASSAASPHASTSSALLPASDEALAFSLRLRIGSGLEQGCADGRAELRSARTRVPREPPPQLCVGTGLEFGAFLLTQPAPLLASPLLEKGESERLRGSASALRGGLCRSLLAVQPDDVKDSALLGLRAGALAAGSLASPVGRASSLSAVGPLLNSPELRAARAEWRGALGSEPCSAKWRAAEGPSFLRLLDEAPSESISGAARAVRELAIARAVPGAGLMAKRDMSRGSCVELLARQPLLRMLIDSP
jgi:hypothetical protein